MSTPWPCLSCSSPNPHTCENLSCHPVPELVQDNDSQPSTPEAEFHDYDDPSYPPEEDGEGVTAEEEAADRATVHGVYEDRAREGRGEGEEDDGERTEDEDDDDDDDEVDCA
jgi:hypothetical protein